MADYVAYPWQLKVHKVAREMDVEGGPDILLTGGARGPGKSHCMLAQVALDDCQRVPGLKWLFLRNLQRSAAESLEDLVFKVMGGTRYKYLSSEGKLDLLNGSKVVIGGYKDDKDIAKYLGIEYDGAVIEELTSITRERLKLLRGSIRSLKPNWRPRIYASTNPGGIGHAWVKEDFVVPYRLKQEKEHRFIPANYRDNLLLEKYDPAYVRYLESLDGDLAEMWREGNWDIFAGMAFPKWKYERHVIEPFQIPRYWPRWVGVDWGLAKPFCALWIAKDPDTGRVFVYRELYQDELADDQQARLIKEYITQEENVVAFFADPSLWTRRSADANISSTAEQYNDNGITLTRGDNHRLNGKRKVDRLLGNLPDGKPGLLVFENCYNFIRTFPNLPRDKVRPEDVDTDAEDHAYDALKYALSSERPLKEEDPRSRRRAKRMLEAAAAL